MLIFNVNIYDVNYEGEIPILIEKRHHLTKEPMLIFNVNLLLAL